MKHKIYKLIDPISLDVKYIGQTTKKLIDRLIGHIRQIETKPFFEEKNNWIVELLKQNYCPIIELIEEVDSSLVKEKERYWVEFYKKSYILYNVIYNENEYFLTILSERKSKKIYEYDLEGNFIKEWGSLLLAATTLNIESSNISYAANGKRKQCGNKMWRYFKKDKIDPYKKSIFKKEVHRYDLEGNYIDSHKSAKDIEGFKYKVISKCCNGKLMSYKKYRFSFEKVEKLPLMTRKNKIKKDIISKELLSEFIEFYKNGMTVKQLSKKYNVSLSNSYILIRNFRKETNFKKQKKSRNV